MVEAYCVKCKAKVQMKDGKETKDCKRHKYDERENVLNAELLSAE